MLVLEGEEDMTKGKGEERKVDECDRGPRGKPLLMCLVSI